jgi:hypothetical protein
MLGDKPVMRAGETAVGVDPFTQDRVDVYEKVIIITETSGTEHCVPHDWFSEVTFK